HDHRADLGKADRPLGDELLERLAVDELGDDVALGAFLGRVVEDLEDVLVAELRDRLGLALEAIARLLVVGEVLVEGLDRDRSLERSIEPAIHDRHAALAHTSQQLVLVEDLTDLDQTRSPAMTMMSGRVTDVHRTSCRPDKVVYAVKTTPVLRNPSRRE